MISAILAAATLLASGPTATGASTAAASPTAPAPADKAKAKGDEVICRSEQVLGTRFPKRVCRTRASIEAQRESDRAEISKIQREQRVGP
jgi:invasion protein IalB